MISFPYFPFNRSRYIFLASHAARQGLAGGGAHIPSARPGGAGRAAMAATGAVQLCAQAPPRGRAGPGRAERRAAGCRCHAVPRPGDPELLQGQPAAAAHAGDDADGQAAGRDVAGRLPAGVRGGGGAAGRRLRAGPELRPAGRRRAAVAAAGVAGRRSRSGHPHQAQGYAYSKCGIWSPKCLR